MAKRVLLFESLDKNVFEMLEPFFQEAGFETHLETDFGNCLETVRRHPPDAVVIITNNVKDWRAFELAEAIRRVHPGCGFVFLYGNDQDGRDPYLNAGYKFQVRAIPMLIPELMTITAQAADSPNDTFVIPQKQDLKNSAGPSTS